MAPPRSWIGPEIAAGAGLGEVFSANVRAALVQIDGNAAGAAAGHNPEYLHQLRVGLRRLRSTLRAFLPLLRRRKSAEFDRALRKILRALGAARDWDVFRGSNPDSRLLQAAQRRSAGAQQRAREMLRSAHFRKTLRHAQTWAQRSPWRSGADLDQSPEAFAPRVLRRLRRDLREEAEGIDWADAAIRHRVRVRAKRLRYGCECFPATYRGREALRHLDRLRKLQQTLGEMNDNAVQRALLQDLARDAGLKKPAAAMQAALAARQQRLIGEVSRRWKNLEATKPFRQRTPV